jgi:hypothetical protein
MIACLMDDSKEFSTCASLEQESAVDEGEEKFGEGG